MRVAIIKQKKKSWGCDLFSSVLTFLRSRKRQYTKKESRKNIVPLQAACLSGNKKCLRPEVALLGCTSLSNEIDDLFTCDRGEKKQREKAEKL